MSRNAIFYHAGGPVCVDAAQRLADAPGRREGSGVMRTATILAGLASLCWSAAASAQQPSGTAGGITAPAGNAKLAPFDIVRARITTDGNTALFHMAVSGKAGANKPTPTGKLAGSAIFSYVWPTSLDPADVGFEPKAGILSLAVTAHPDFDDTPFFDENGDGDPANDGNVWHVHWVVLGPDEACGKGALKIIDIPAGTKPRLPKTWPGLPILIDSPGWHPQLTGSTVEVRVPFDDIAPVENASFDGVTSGLRVNANVHAPLVCVTDVFDVASGNLSLPGRVGR